MLVLQVLNLRILSQLFYCKTYKQGKLEGIWPIGLSGQMFWVALPLMHSIHVNLVIKLRSLTRPIISFSKIRTEGSHIGRTVGFVVG